MPSTSAETSLVGESAKQPGCDGSPITITAVLNVWTGYGQLACESIAGLSRRGWKVDVKAIRKEESWHGYPATLPMAITDRCVTSSSNETELLITSLDRPNIPTPGKRTVIFSMFESTRISREQVAVLNRGHAVIVPGGWVRDSFSKSGVTKPIHVVPLGVWSEIFPETAVPQGSPCVFGAGGCMSASASRKSIETIVEAFQEAFDIYPDAELRVKLLPGEKLNIATDDKRIRVNAELMTWLSLARWNQGLTCFCNIGVEGWGLMAIQAMCSGRPVMYLNFGGSTEFLNEQCGYPLRPHLHFCRSLDSSLGAMAMVDKNELRDEMRRVYLDRKEALEKGRAAAIRAREFTWNRTINELEKVLKGII